MTIRRLFLGVIASLSAIALAGCNTSLSPSDSQTGDNSTQQNEQHNAGEQRTVTDMAGREVTVPEQIDTVGTLGSVGVLNAFVQLMGQDDKILNQMPERFATGDQWQMQYEFSPQLSQGPVFEEGGEVIIEELLANQPDVTFTMTKETAEQLEEIGAPAIYLEWNDVDDVKDTVTLVGEVLNVGDRAEAYLEYFDATQDQARELLAELPEAERITVLYGDPVEFRQPHVIAEWWIDQAGGISVTDDGRTDDTLEYTMEDLLAWDPQMIILTDTQQQEEIAANDTYAQVDAVKSDALHTIPSVAHIWGNRTVEQPLTVLWTLHHLYPDLLSREELETEITQFYNDFFDYGLSTDQVADIIDR